jgi:hypothetical protein
MSQTGCAGSILKRPNAGPTCTASTYTHLGPKIATHKRRWRTCTHARRIQNQLRFAHQCSEKTAANFNTSSFELPHRFPALSREAPQGACVASRHSVAEMSDRFVREGPGAER